MERFVETREARRLLEASGILAGYRSMRHRANVEAVYAYERTRDIHGLIPEQDLTGIPAF